MLASWDAGLVVARGRLANFQARRRQAPSRPLIFRRSGRRKLLLVTLADRISQSQIYPFHFFRQRLDQQLQVDVQEIGLESLLARPERGACNADVVCFQSWINRTPVELAQVALTLRRLHPGAKLVFLDPCAPTDLRYAAALDPHVDLYVKKHALRDRSRYKLPTMGDTTLVESYARRYGQTLPVTHFEVSDGLLNKLLVGPGFLLSPQLLPDFVRRSRPRSAVRVEYDLHARIGGSGTRTWYELMRSESLAAVARLQGVKVTGQGNVRKLRYTSELMASRTCFSPFGYGEVCWRDYEAIHAGALLIKPDTRHVETAPDFFEDDGAYVALQWNLDDFDDKLHFYLANPARIAAKVAAAYGRLAGYVRGDGFLGFVGKLVAS